MVVKPAAVRLSATNLIASKAERTIGVDQHPARIAWTGIRRDHGLRAVSALIRTASTAVGLIGVGLIVAGSTEVDSATVDLVAVTLAVDSGARDSGAKVSSAKGT